RDILGVLKTETACVTESTDLLVVDFCKPSLASILYHHQVMLLRNRHDPFHICGKPGYVYRKDRTCTRRDLLFDLIHIDLESRGVCIHKNRDCPCLKDRLCCGDECIRRYQYLIAPTDIQLYERSNHR